MPKYKKMQCPICDLKAKALVARECKKRLVRHILVHHTGSNCFLNFKGEVILASDYRYITKNEGLCPHCMRWMKDVDCLTHLFDHWDEYLFNIQCAMLGVTSK